ncbi:lipoprotein [Spiroplasma endosymbiont of Agriotes lineatus]|uniref:lipoprotein n=1 Tax=Spiroplasma endosymbiont of Agriotes lineatus TaxID=3077930 RepID=UPI0030CBCFE8
MKKLLSLLGVITISGTAMPTIIAASSFQKHKQINELENSQINYQQANNLEKLNRNKREKIYNADCANKLIAGVGAGVEFAVGGGGTRNGWRVFGAAAGAAIGSVLSLVLAP